MEGKKSSTKSVSSPSRRKPVHEEVDEDLERFCQLDLKEMLIVIYKNQRVSRDERLAKSEIARRTPLRGEKVMINTINVHHALRTIYKYFTTLPFEQTKALFDALEATFEGVETDSEKMKTNRTFIARILEMVQTPIPDTSGINTFVSGLANNTPPVIRKEVETWTKKHQTIVNKKKVADKVEPTDVPFIREIVEMAGIEIPSTTTTTTTSSARTARRIAASKSPVKKTVLASPAPCSVTPEDEFEDEMEVEEKGDAHHSDSEDSRESDRSSVEDPITEQTVKPKNPGKSHGDK